MGGWGGILEWVVVDGIWACFWSLPNGYFVEHKVTMSISPPYFTVAAWVLKKGEKKLLNYATHIRLNTEKEGFHWLPFQ